jgi:hypothetical protein
MEPPEVADILEELSLVDRMPGFRSPPGDRGSEVFAYFELARNLTNECARQLAGISPGDRTDAPG